MLSNSQTSFHIKSPLVLSHEISLINSDAEFKRNIYLKLDNCQPSGSFKIRGIGNLISKSLMSKPVKQLIASSGGNAGLATAYVGNKLNIKATIVVPSTTTEPVKNKLRSYNAEVIVHGEVWDKCNEEALRLSKNEGSLYVPPFDHELIWDGVASIVDELKEQLNNSEMPDCIIASVGGGGLALGIIEGLIRNNWMDKDIKLIAVETLGADCFNRSIKENRLVTLDGITSIAKSLGAKTCAKKLFEYYAKYQDKIDSVVVEDKDVVEVMCKFIDDHRFMVEPGCAASLTVAYNLDKYLGKHKYRNVVVEVCGGSGITLDQFNDYKAKFNL